VLVGFAPSFSFILIGAERFDRLRANETVRAFLDGADPAAIGVIAGAAVPFALALKETWQVAVLAAERSGSWRPLGPDDLLDLGPPPVMQHSEPDPDTQRQQPSFAAPASSPSGSRTRSGSSSSRSSPGATGAAGTVP
jgi:Chromate transporter